jgi:hypothetical protein
MSPAIPDNLTDENWRELLRWRANWLQPAFGQDDQKAGRTTPNPDVRFTPESGHSVTPVRCLLCANSGQNR